MTRIAVVLASALLWWGTLGVAAVADLGAAIDLGRIDIRDPVRPGTELDLPLLTVRNPGTEVGTYRMDVAPFEGGGDVDSAWGRFSPDSFRLEPGRRQPVEATIVVPATAAPGSYELLVRAGVSADDPGLAQVGGAAASRVTLVVADPSVLRAIGRGLGELVTQRLPWVLGAALAVGIVMLLRRYRVDLVRR